MKDYEIGFGKPPKHRQYKKGQSGNPKGRPVSGKLRAGKIMADFLEEKVEITEGGKIRRVTRRDLPVLKWIRQASQGDVKAAAQVLEQHHLSKKDGDYRHRPVSISESEAKMRRITPDMTPEEIVAAIPLDIEWSPKLFKELGLYDDVEPGPTLNQILTQSKLKKA